MLTTTYSITVLSSEQQKARRILGRLQQCLQQRAPAAGTPAAGSTVDVAWLEKVSAKLAATQRFCRERKIELYLIPALRKMTDAMGALLERLASLAADALRIFDYASTQMRRALDGAEIDAGLLASVTEVYCRLVQEQLALEDNELLPAARRVLSNEDWFQVAAQCLSHGARNKASRHPPVPDHAARVNRYRPRYAH